MNRRNFILKFLAKDTFGLLTYIKIIDFFYRLAEFRKGSYL